MPSQDDEQPRRIGGRYRLSTLLGSGAMGTVWSGYDEVLRRRVAVKELKIPPGVPAQEALDMRERIMREARALGGLSHPNIITVFDVVVDDGAPVVVLEMVPSHDLATMIGQNGKLSPTQAAVIGFTTAGALRAAHRSGITHRDVKPGNVLVADDGRVKLTDFGIARNVADAPMTSAGLVLGSPAYIAPEVAAGQPVTPAADLWGLGATLFAAVEGRPPYDVQGDPVRTITEVVDGEVPRPRVTGPVGDVIVALMVKDPDGRMALEEVRRRLRPLIQDPDDPVYPGSPDAPTLVSPIARADRADAGRSPSLVKQERGPGESARPSSGRSQSGLPQSGLPQSGLPQSGLPQSGLPQSGLPQPPARATPDRAPSARAQPDRPAAAPGRGQPDRSPTPAPHETADPPTPAIGRWPAGDRPAPSPGRRTDADPPAGSGTSGEGGHRPTVARATDAGPRSSPGARRSDPPPARPVDIGHRSPSAARPGEPGYRSPSGSGRADSGPPSRSATEGARASYPPPVRPIGDSGSASAARSAPAAGSVPLAAAPGPLPAGVRAAAPEAEPARHGGASDPPSGWVAAGLVVVGAAVVLAGIAAGWVATRAVGGESPWSTVNVSTTDSP